MKNLKEGKFYKFTNTRGTEEEYLRIDTIHTVKATVTYLDSDGNYVRKGTINIDGDFAQSLQVTKKLEPPKEFYIVWNPSRQGKRKMYRNLNEAKERAEEIIEREEKEIFILKKVLRAYAPKNIKFEE